MLVGEKINDRDVYSLSFSKYSLWSMNVLRQVEFTVLSLVFFICFIDFSIIWNYSSTKYLRAINSISNETKLLEGVVVKHQLAIPIPLEKYLK